MSAAWNMPDDCGPFTSDLDYHQFYFGRWDDREPDEDPNEEEDEDNEI